MAKMKISVCLMLKLLASTISAVTIAQINGDRFISPYNGQTVSDVTGVVTAKGPDGIWIQSVSPLYNGSASDAIYVYGSALARNSSIVPGHVLLLSGTVSEYRSSRDYLYLTELASTTVTAVMEQAREVAPRVIGLDTPNPPTVQYSSLDGGDVFGVPNNQSLISVVNPVLQPASYGLDFWESLSGQLVTVRQARAIARPNSFGDQWVVGSWPTTGDNGRTGLTLSRQGMVRECFDVQSTCETKKQADGNPEAILIGDPLDGSSNPTDTKLGDKLEDITGVVSQAFGFYRILPLTTIKVTESLTPALPPPTRLVSAGACSGLTVASYNVENLAPSDVAHVGAVAAHIVDYLITPDLVFLQEMQDNDGETDSGVVDSDITLSALVDAIKSRGGPTYSFTYIAPVDGQDGGAPGGNIRVAYLFRADVVQLRNANPGNATTATRVLPGPELSHNPGRIDPSNAAWDDSRKPLAAAWQTLDGNTTFFTVNVHWASKGGSSPIHADARPPVNGAVEKRQAQAETTATFIASILAQDPSALIIAAGDFNEYAVSQPILDFQTRSRMRDLDDAAGVAVAERYSYLYDMNSQALDHTFVSPALAEAVSADAGVFEHVHVNTWVAYDDQVSDHDPSVARLDLCGGGGGGGGSSSRQTPQHHHVGRID